VNSLAVVLICALSFFGAMKFGYVCLRCTMIKKVIAIDMVVNLSNAPHSTGFLSRAYILNKKWVAGIALAKYSANPNYFFGVE